VTENNKGTSLLHFGIFYGCKMFYDTCPGPVFTDFFVAEDNYIVTALILIKNPSLLGSIWSVFCKLDRFRAQEKMLKRSSL
jgi:hypothetical protein